MASRTYYNTTTGEITLAYDNANLPLPTSTDPFIDNEYYSMFEYWINGTTPTLRADMPITINKSTINTDGIDTVTIGNIPTNAVATITTTSEESVSSNLIDPGNVTTLTITDGTLNITATEVCDMEINIRLYPQYIDYSTTVNAISS